MFVYFFESSIFFKEVFFISNDVVSFDTVTEFESFYHFCILELLTNFANVLISLSVLIVFEKYSDCFLVLLNIGIESGQFYSIFYLFFDLANYLCSCSYSCLPPSIDPGSLGH